MAIGTPTERYAQSLAAQGASSAISPTGTIAAGTFVVLLATSSIDAKVVSSITDDSGGNTWNVDVAYNAAGDVLNVSIASCQVQTQMTTGTTITVNYGVATNNQVHLWLEEFTGIVTSSALDQTATANSGGASAISSSPSGTLAQADELVVAAVRSEDLAGWTKGATYTDFATPSLGAPLSGAEYKIVSATTAVVADGTQTSTTANWAIALATYKGAVVSATDQLNPGFRGMGIRH